MPRSVKYFEWTWLGSLALGIVVAALSYSAIVQPGTEFFAGFIQFFVFGITLLLVLLTSRKRSNLSKWILLILFASGIVFFIPQLSALFKLGFAGVLSSIQVLLQCIGVYFLFTVESRHWFKNLDKNAPEIET